MNRSELSGKVLSGLKWTATLRIIGQLISWSMSVIIIRYIKPEEYGLKSMAEITMGLLMIFSSGGMESSIIQVKELSKDKIQKIFGMLIAINLLLFSLQVVGSYPLAEYYHEPKIIPLVQAMAIGFLFVPFNAIPSALLSRAMDYRMLSTVSLVTNIVGAACTLIMALLGFGVWSLVFGQLLIAFLNALIMNIYKPCLPLPKFSIHGISDMAAFGGTWVLTSLLWVVYSRSDIFIGGRFLSTHDVGIYGVALLLASLPSDKILPILNQVAFPAYARIRDNKAAVAKYFLMSVRLTSLVLFPISFGLVGTAQHLIPVVLGNRWIDVSAILLVLGLIFPIRGISALCAPMTNAMGRPGIQLRMMTMALILMIPGFLIGVHFGVLGMASAWVFVYPWVMLSNLWASNKLIGIKFFSFIRAIMPPLFMSSIMLFVLLCFSSLGIVIENAWVTIGVMVVTGACVYGMGMYVLAKQRLFELRNLLRK